MAFPKIILDILFPKRCVGCDKIGTYFCKSCIGKIKFTEHQICPVCGKWALDGAAHPRCKTRYTIDGLTSFFHYDGVIQKAVKLLKYRFVSDLARDFIDLISSPFSQPIIDNSLSTILIPVPLHSSRQKFRGFNQAEILGKLIADRFNIPLRVDILKRVKKTKPQVETKDRKKRLANMENVFAVSPNISISQYPNILLFDDVFTTGATLRAAANVLKRAGVRKVWGLVMAHG